ncbi:DNA primase catalytic subunit PriS [Candidatus Micrarchaeota archaeon]|nr:DNA primase catalytic subunit PriS [Candidatus Micrarchaeota archaeon]
MNEKSQQYLKHMIKQYYDSVSVNPRDIGAREVGYGTLEQKIAVRHLGFKNNQEFNDFLRNTVPFYVSASSAYYDKPDARPMASKVWQGADLVFDLDLHPEEWDPKNQYKEYHSLMHPLAFEKVKEIALKLVDDFLIPDFGFNKDNISINFSGNRGYHIRVYDNSVKNLSSKERREIVDYIAGRGLKFENFFEIQQKQIHELGRPITIISKGPRPDDFGWAGRIARILMKQDHKSDILPKELRSKPKLEKFKQGVEEGHWDKVKVAKKEEVWKDLVNYSAVMVGEPTDVNVTIDTTKVLRIPDTIHSGSSLCAKEFDYKFIDKFDPLIHAVAFTDSENVKVNILKKVPVFNIKGTNYDELNMGEAELPICYGLYLMCKGYAEIVS